MIMSEKMSGNTYRITIEAIGPEEEVFNFGAPMILNSDGFFIIAEDQDQLGLVVHRISPAIIAEAINSSGHAHNIMMAMALQKMKNAMEEATA
jgi:hypothetical protein